MTPRTKAGVRRGLIGLLILGGGLVAMRTLAVMAEVAPMMAAVIVVASVSTAAGSWVRTRGLRAELRAQLGAVPGAAGRVAQLEREVRVADQTARLLLLPMQGTEPVKAASWLNGKLVDAEWAAAAMRAWETAHDVQREQRARDSIEDVLDPADERLWLNDFVAAGKSGRVAMRAGRRERRLFEELGL